MTVESLSHSASPARRASAYLSFKPCARRSGPASSKRLAVQGYNSNTAAAKAFTSLEGVWFSISGTGYSQLTLLNGWWHAPFSTRNAVYSVERGMVRLSGAVATTSGNTNNVIFRLPAGARPSSTAWIPVNLCGAAGGRLNIFPDGTVKVQAEMQLSDATCFTSLEGVRFGL